MEQNNLATNLSPVYEVVDTDEWLNSHHRQLMGQPHYQLEQPFEDACFDSAAAAPFLAVDASSASLAPAVVAAEASWDELVQVVFCLRSASPAPQCAFQGLPVDTQSQDCGFQ